MKAFCLKLSIKYPFSRQDKGTPTCSIPRIDVFYSLHQGTGVQVRLHPIALQHAASRRVLSNEENRESRYLNIVFPAHIVPFDSIADSCGLVYFGRDKVEVLDVVFHHVESLKRFSEHFSHVGALEDGHISKFQLNVFGHELAAPCRGIQKGAASMELHA